MSLFSVASVRCTRPSLIAVAALLLAGCGTVTVPRSSIAGDHVEAIDLRRLSFCASVSEAAAVSLLADAAAVQAWQAGRRIDLIGAESLPSGPFAVVEHGARTTTGYSLLVSRQAYQAGRVLRLTASFIGPKDEGQRGYALTSPCTLVKLPPGNYDRLELVDPSGRRRASSINPPLPSAAANPAQ